MRPTCAQIQGNLHKTSQMRQVDPEAYTPQSPNKNSDQTRNIPATSIEHMTYYTTRPISTLTFTGNVHFQTHQSDTLLASNLSWECRLCVRCRRFVLLCGCKRRCALAKVCPRPRGPVHRPDLVSMHPLPSVCLPPPLYPAPVGPDWIMRMQNEFFY